MEPILDAGLLVQGALALLAGLLCSLIGFAVAVRRYRRACAARAAALADLDRLRDARSLLAELRGHGLTLQVLADGLARLERQWALDARLALVPGREARGGHALAIRLAQAGASVDELCSSCGMTRSEAELVLRLHRDARSPAGGRRLAATG